MNDIKITFILWKYRVRVRDLAGQLMYLVLVYPKWFSRKVDLIIIKMNLC